MKKTTKTNANTTADLQELIAQEIAKALSKASVQEVAALPKETKEIVSKVMSPKKMAKSFKELPTIKAKSDGIRVELSEYKGQKIFGIKKGDYNMISFGVAKAKLLLENIDAIRAFVAENE